LPVRNPGEKSKGRSWSFYGAAGTGKSTLASTFPGPVLFLDCKDDGDDSYAGVKGAKVRDITTTEEFEETYWWLVENPGVYKTVVVDTVTQLQQIKVEELYERKKSKKSTKAAGDWGSMTKADWGEVSGWMKMWITNYRDLEVEVVFLAQDRVFNAGDEEESEIGEISPEVGPRLSPAVKSHLCSAVSVVGYTFIRTRKKEVGMGKQKKEKEVTEFCIRLGPSASFITKFRKPKEISLPDFLVDPTYEDILKTIEGN
jgi:AAA domain